MIQLQWGDEPGVWKDVPMFRSIEQAVEAWWDQRHEASLRGTKLPPDPKFREIPDLNRRAS